MALVAYDNLNPRAKSAVDALLKDAQKQYKTASGKTLLRGCRVTKLKPIAFFATWADDARLSVKSSAPWHFWDIPLATDTASLTQFCDTGCVVKAIHDEVAVLTSSTAKRTEKQQALLFIVHLTGDLHQPMHIVDNGDRGGNCVPVSFNVVGFSSKTALSRGSYEPNLHAIWDSNMIAVYSNLKQSLSADAKDAATQAWVSGIEQSNAHVIEQEASQKVTLESTKALVDWALAAHKLAGPESYDKMPRTIPVNAHPVTVTSCGTISTKFLKLNEVADKGMTDGAQPVVERQIALAAGRLAAILNTVWP